MMNKFSLVTHVIVVQLNNTNRLITDYIDKPISLKKKEG